MDDDEPLPLSVGERSIQTRILGAAPPLEVCKPSDLLNQLRAILNTAFNEERLETPQADIPKHVKLDPKERRDEPERPRAGRHVVVGGIKSFRREREDARLVRDDGAFIHFTITVCWDGADSLTLEAYDFEIVFPKGHAPRFLRIDLNESGHRNESRELRSHCHPGNDDFLVPAPVMTPREILLYLLNHLRARDPDKPRGA